MNDQGRLVILRHGESVWNQKNVFTGWVNVPLSRKGIEEALLAGKKIAHLAFSVVYVSELIRAQMTALLALADSEEIPLLQYQEERGFAGWHKIHGKPGTALPVIPVKALNERYYGKLQGCNKEEIKKEFGEELFKKWRRSYDIPPPEGESLEMTIERGAPFFKEEVIPRLDKGETVLICAHGNSIRGMIMEMEKLSKEEVVSLEIPTGEPISYLYHKGAWSREEL